MSTEVANNVVLEGQKAKIGNERFQQKLMNTDGMSDSVCLQSRRTRPKVEAAARRSTYYVKSGLALGGLAQEPSSGFFH